MSSGCVELRYFLSSATLIIALCVLGCADNSREREIEISCIELAQQFTRALTSRNYDRAFSMVATTQREKLTVDHLKEGFERIIPQDWGDTEPIEADLLPGGKSAYQPGDVAIIYVSIYGDVYSEALVISFVLEDDVPMVGDVEFGRP